MRLAETAVHPGAANAVVFSVPRVAGQVRSKRYRVVHFTESEGLVTAIIPTGAEKGTEVRWKLLFQIHAEARLHRAGMPMSRNVRCCITAFHVRLICFAVISQVCMVDKGKH